MRRTAPPADRARLFVALELPDQVRDALVSWRGAVLGTSSTLRLVAREHLHITLCFLGSHGLSDVDGIATACRAAAEGQTGMVNLELQAPLWLPPRRPRVLTVGLADPNGAARALQAGLSERLAEGGWYEPESRPYLPHVTVARVPARERVRPDPLPDPPPLAFAGTEVTLYRSHLGRGGAHYEPLHRIAVGPPPG